MNPVQHARSSAHHHGGVWRDYVNFHLFFDQSKAAFPQVQHRIFLHTLDLGYELARRVHGETLMNSDGTAVSVRALTEQHMREDLGFRLGVDDWLNLMPEPLWYQKRDRVRLPREVEAFASEPEVAAAAMWGGEADEYKPVTEFLDLASTFTQHPLAHLILNNSLGLFLAEQALGPAIETRDGRIVPTRLVAEKIVHARTRRIATPEQVAGGIRLQPWMHGALVREAKALWGDE